MSRNPTTDDDFRRELCDWVSANGINPSTVPVNSPISIADGQLTFVRKVQRDGRDIVNPTGPYGVHTETVTVPLVVEPTSDIAEWLRTRCPTCGR